MDEPEKPLTQRQIKTGPGGKKRFFHLWARAWQEAIEGDAETAMGYVDLVRTEGYEVVPAYLGALRRTIDEVGRGEQPTLDRPPFAATKAR